MEKGTVYRTLFVARVQESLTYALKQIKDQTERHLVAQEFWHSLNRKGYIANNEVEPLINLTIES